MAKERLIADGYKIIQSVEIAEMEPIAPRKPSNQNKSGPER